MRHPWFAVTRWGAVAWALFMAVGCAAIPQQPSAPAVDSAAVSRQAQDRQVIVTLAPERWERITESIEQRYGLTRLGAFHMTVLGVQCIRFQVPEGRSIDAVIARLAADRRVKAVQLNQRFQGLGVAYNDQYASLQYGVRAIRADAAHRWATGKGVKVDGAAGEKLAGLLAAPGIDILTTTPPANWNPDKGSSFAAAHVTGVAALLLERDPGLSPKRLRDILHKTARPTQAAGGKSQPAIGIVDACAALEKLLGGRLCP